MDRICSDKRTHSTTYIKVTRELGYAILSLRKRIVRSKHPHTNTHIRQLKIESNFQPKPWMQFRDMHCIYR